MLELRAPSRHSIRVETRLTGALSTRNSHSRIIAAARAKMLANPGTKFTVQDIAEATHLSRRAIYNHFPNPEALYRAALRDLVGELGDMVDIDLSRDLTPDQAVCAFARAAAALLSSEKNLLIWAAIVADDGSEDWLASAYSRMVRQPLIRSIEIYLLHRRVIDDLGAMDPRRAAEQLVGMIEAASVTPNLLKMHRPPHPIDESELRFIASTFLAAHFPTFEPESLDLSLVEAAERNELPEPRRSVR